MCIVEIGSGAGFSEFFVHPRPLLTDVISYPWTDKLIDATNMDFDDNSIDAIIAVDTIHHLSSPIQFFNESYRVLKKGGIILISDINASLYTRIGLRLLKLEGWSFDVDVFDKNAVVNDGKNPWSGNNAVSRLLFDNPQKFESEFKNFGVESIENKFFLSHIFSGGAMVCLNTCNIPKKLLRIIEKVDDFLTFFAPNIFAVNKRIVLRKKV